jgi:hypothetical protein
MGAIDETCSAHSNSSSLDLDAADRLYLEALRDRDHVATKTTRQPLGLYSVIAFVLQQVIGKSSLKLMTSLLTQACRHWNISDALDCHTSH